MLNFPPNKENKKIELWVSSQRFDVSFDWIKLSLMTDLLCVSMTEKTGQCSTFFTDFFFLFLDLTLTPKF